MARVSYEDLSKIRAKFKNKIIVFCSGVFDLTHAGHALFFEDCKKHGDILVVGVGCDADIKKYKGENRPILNEHVRWRTVDMMKPVDYSFLSKPVAGDNVLGHLKDIFLKLKPDAYVVNDDAFDIAFRRQLVDKLETELIILRRMCPPEFENISTTKIIQKIKEF